MEEAPVRIYPRIKNAILLTLLLLAFHLALGGVAGMFMVAMPGSVPAGLGNILAFLSVIAGYALVLPIGLKKAGWGLPVLLPHARISGYRYLVPVFLSAFGLMIINSMSAAYLMHAFYSARKLPDLVAGMMENSAPVNFLFLVVLIPLCEELFFRGFLLNGLRKHYTGTASLVLTSVLFGLIHISPTQVVSATLLGLIAGQLLIVTGNIVTPILFHGLYNFFVLFFPPLLETPLLKDRPFFYKNSFYQFDFIDVTGILLLAAGVFCIVRMSRRQAAPGSPGTDV